MIRYTQKFVKDFTLYTTIHLDTMRVKEKIL